ncbi:chromosome segregation protein SMC [Candidatus Woesearchaeota archaeon]|nr:MAG: chromosome segregation protein SMC [Candidatus Woesearchaeota archaeon]
MQAEARPAVQKQDGVKSTKILRLVLDGFKSFGKHTELVLGDKFNVVIGPNGSGKSNIIDALCFVLGKSSSKQLRAEKSANLIYNGGKTRQPAKNAEVSIVFDNSDGAFPVSDSEVKISRIVRSDGSSRYKINNVTKTRSEMIELLRSARIDPDGYNIILQGDIVRLVEMSPVERRQIIEEISGIGAYEEKKQRALRELEKVEERLNEVEIILKEREGYLKELRKDRDQALKYKNLKDRVEQSKATYLKKRLDRKEAEFDRLEKKSASFKARLEKIQSKIDKLRSEIAERKEEISRINKEIEQKGEIEQVKIQKEVERLRVELATGKSRISACRSEIERIGKRRESIEKSAAGVEERLLELAKRKASAKAELEALSKTISDLDDKIRAFKEKHKIADEAEIDARFEELDRKGEQVQKELHSLRERQQQLIREKDKVEFQVSTIDEKIAKVKELEDAHKEEVNELKGKKAEFKKLVLELNELLNNDTKDANSLARLREEVHSLQEKEHKLELKQSSVKERLSGNIAVKKVVENAKLFGQVYGTVAELASSEGKYSLALEVAAAQRMHSLIVDSDKTASRAIKYLRSEKLGSATFLPLNKIKPARIPDSVKELSKKPGVCGLAIDLVDFEPQFKNAFSHVFGATLVVKSLDVARKLGIGNARMVTLDGDLCESSGVMTGGYRHRKSGGFREKEVSANLEKVRERLSKAQQELSSIQKRRSDNEARIVRVRELKAALEGEIIKQEKSLHIETGDLEASRAFKEQLLKQSASLDKELRALEDELSEKTRDLASVKMEREKLRERISQMRNPRILAELNAFEQKKRQLEQESVRADSELKHLEAQENEISGKDKENISRLLAELDLEKANYEKELEELEAKVKSAEKDLKSKEEEQARFFSAFKGLFEKSKRLSDEVNAREMSLLKTEESSRKEELQLNALSIEEARVKAEIAGLREEFEQFSGVELDMNKSEEQLKKDISSFERMMANIGNVNLRALEIYDTVEKEYSSLVDKKKVLSSEKEDVLKLMEEIESTKKDLFMETLKGIDSQFKRIFSQLMSKGKAYLELEDEKDPFAGGLRIKVRLTGNKFLDIRSLSGGEKTMTALSFLFALQEHEPASFYVLDEVDAALDKHNSEKLAKLIRSYCSNAQYFVISHNDALIAEGDILYGVSMDLNAGLSKVVGLKL